MQNAESNDWEDESATASREEMLERQVQSLFEEKLGYRWSILACELASCFEPQEEASLSEDCGQRCPPTTNVCSSKAFRDN